MIIEANAWHARWYRYWLEHGRGNAPGYRANLCHYVRVLLFWAPMTWVDQHSAFDWGRLASIIFLGGAALYFLGLFGFLLVLAAVTETTKFLMAIGSLAGLIAVLASPFVIYRLSRDRELRMPGTLKLAGSYVVAKKQHICPFITFRDHATPSNAHNTD